MSKEAIVLLNMGGPNNLEEVEVFLINMFNDENILNIKSPYLRGFVASMITFFRTQKAQEIYRQIGGKSPLVDHTKRLVSKLQNCLGEDILVDFAMRYTPPFSSEVIKRLNEANIDKIYLIPLYPQYSTTTVKSSLEEFEREYHKSGEDAILVEIKHFFQNQSYNQAILESIKNTLGKDDAGEFVLLFSAHGLPKKVVQNGDVYQKHIHKHIEILTKMLHSDDLHFAQIELAYQSKVGPMEWLEPSLEDKLSTMRGKKVVVFPIAFSVDNSETDYELKKDFKNRSASFAIEDFRVCECPNDSDLFVKALSEIYLKMRQ